MNKNYLYELQLFQNLIFSSFYIPFRYLQTD